MEGWYSAKRQLIFVFRGCLIALHFRPDKDIILLCFCTRVPRPIPKKKNATDDFLIYGMQRTKTLSLKRSYVHTLKNL